MEKVEAGICENVNQKPLKYGVFFFCYIYIHIHLNTKELNIMKLTKTQLKEIIKEEVSRLNEKKAAKIAKPEDLLKGRTIKSVKKGRLGDQVVTFEDGLVVTFSLYFGDSGTSVQVYKGN